jgi:hypothetical protein
VRDPLKGWTREDGALAGALSFQYAPVAGAGLVLEFGEVGQAGVAAQVAGAVDDGLDPRGGTAAAAEAGREPRALVATGTTVTSAGLVLSGTFAVVGARQGSDQLRDIGAALALGVLMDTFGVRTLLVPSTVVLLGRRNWWPSRVGTPGAAAAGHRSLRGSAPGSAEVSVRDVKTLPQRLTCDVLS